MNTYPYRHPKRNPVTYVMLHVNTQTPNVGGVDWAYIMVFESCSNGDV